MFSFGFCLVMIYAGDSVEFVLKTIMKLLKRKSSARKTKKQKNPVPITCRCGGKPSKPATVEYCNDRWVISCQVERCYANNKGQGLADTINGWNRLSTHFYR